MLDIYRVEAAAGSKMNLLLSATQPANPH